MKVSLPCAALGRGGCPHLAFSAAAALDLEAKVASLGGGVHPLEPPELVLMVRHVHYRGLEARGGMEDS